VKIIKSSYEIIPLPDPLNQSSVLKHLEKIGRTCYKSEDNITDDSCIQFLTSLRDKKHTAMLEHFPFTLEIPQIYYDMQFQSEIKLRLFDCPMFNHAFKFITVTKLRDKPKCIITGSATAFNTLWDLECVRCNPQSPANKICTYLWSKYRHIMKVPENWEAPETAIPDIRLLSKDEIDQLPYNIRLYHKYMTVKFVIPRAITHELVRHRVASFAQESTRYVNYSKGKFGNEITVIEPTFWSDPVLNGTQYLRWKTLMGEIERTYMELIKMGALPQEAATILPNSLKAEIVVTANLNEWKHILTLRTAASAHPQMREVCVPLLEEVKSQLEE
jgi:thymidylate synthase (FAD)